MKLYKNINMGSMAGLGPAAWDSDLHKMSMHPPLPGHIEYVEEEMQRHSHQHHVVHRHNPENDCDKVSIKELSPKDLKQLLSGKAYISQTSEDRKPVEPSTARALKEEGKDDPIDPLIDAEPA